MDYTIVEKKDWGHFFDLISKYVHGQRVTIEIVAENLGDQFTEEGNLMEGLSYDPEDDILYVHSVSFDHTIPNPVEVAVDALGPAVKSIGIKDAEGQRQIIQFREPLLLMAG